MSSCGVLSSADAGAAAHPFVGVQHYHAASVFKREVCCKQHGTLESKESDVPPQCISRCHDRGLCGVKWRRGKKKKRPSVMLRYWSNELFFFFSERLFHAFEAVFFFFSYISFSPSLFLFSTVLNFIIVNINYTSTQTQTHTYKAHGAWSPCFCFFFFCSFRFFFALLYLFLFIYFHHKHLSRVLLIAVGSTH